MKGLIEELSKRVERKITTTELIKSCMCASMIEKMAERIKSYSPTKPLKPKSKPKPKKKPKPKSNPKASPGKVFSIGKLTESLT